MAPASPRSLTDSWGQASAFLLGETLPAMFAEWVSGCVAVSWSLDSRGEAGGQQKTISQDSIDFQATGASCRLDSAQVLMGTSPGQSRTEAEKERGDRQTGGCGLEDRERTDQDWT